MKTKILAALIFVSSASVVLAQAAPAPTPGSVNDKVMKDQPGTKGGSTDMPTTQPDSSSLSEQSEKDHNGAVNTGTTEMPTAKPNSSSLSDKAAKDQLKTN